MAEKKKKQQAEFAKDVQKPKQPKPFEQDFNVSVKRDGSKQGSRPDNADVWDNRSSFQSGTQKTAGQKAKSSQKKRRQQGQFHKENSFKGQQ